MELELNLALMPVLVPVLGWIRRAQTDGRRVVERQGE